MNMAWQIFVDKLTREPEQFFTEEVTVQMAEASVPQYGGSLENAIRSKMPGLEPVPMAAEMVVDSIIIQKVGNGELPVGVFSPVHTPEHNTHGQVQSCNIDDVELRAFIGL